jgi:hypothetical protein
MHTEKCVQACLKYIIQNLNLALFNSSIVVYYRLCGFTERQLDSLFCWENSTSLIWYVPSLSNSPYVKEER